MKFVQERWREFLTEVIAGAKPWERPNPMEFVREVWFSAFVSCMRMLEANTSDGKGITVKDRAFAGQVQDEMTEFYHDMVSRAATNLEGRQLEHFTEPELKSFMDSACRAVEDIGFCHGVGRTQFLLLVFNDPKLCQYAANCTRATMIEAMKEAVARLESKEDVAR